MAELATHVQDNNSHDSDAIQETAAAEKESAKYTVSLPSIKMSEKMFSGILGSAKEFAEMQKALLKSIEPLGINVLDISRTTKMVEQIAKYLDANSAISTAALQAISQQERLLSVFQSQERNLAQIINNSLNISNNIPKLLSVSLPNTAWVNELLKIAAIHIDSATIINSISFPDLLSETAARFVSDAYSELAVSPEVNAETYTAEIFKKSIEKIPLSVPDSVRRNIIGWIFTFILVLLPMIQNHHIQQGDARFQEELLSKTRQSNELQEKLLSKTRQSAEQQENLLEKLSTMIDEAQQTHTSRETSILLAKRTVRVRVNPNSKGGIAYTLNVGQVVYVIEESGNWLFVKYTNAAEMEEYGWVTRSSFVLPQNFEASIKSKQLKQMNQIPQ